MAFGAALVHAAHAPTRSGGRSDDRGVSLPHPGPVLTPEDPGAATAVAARVAPEAAAGRLGEATRPPESNAAQRPEPATMRELPEVDALMERALQSRKTPGAVVIAGRRSGVVFRRAYGHRALVPERLPMTTDTVFDLASLSKPLVVGTLVQWLIERGKLTLRDSVASHLPEFAARGKQALTVEQLLLHTSGLPPTNSLRDYRGSRERSRALALAGYPEALAGRRFIYSDVGFIALGEMIQRMLGEPLDQTAERVIFSSLGMSDTRYCRSMCDGDHIAPTELNWGWTRSPIRGEVNDPRAYRLGGVAGNAGVFSTGDDLARFARMLLARGELEGTRILSEASVERFTRPRAVPGATRALGWDVSSGFSTARGRRLSERAYGHGGSTGTSLWVDPELDLFVVFLSNRNHPFGRGRVLELQGAIADAVVAALNPIGAPVDPHAEAESPRAAITPSDGLRARPHDVGGG